MIKKDGILGHEYKMNQLNSLELLTLSENVSSGMWSSVLLPHCLTPSEHTLHAYESTKKNGEKKKCFPPEIHYLMKVKNGLLFPFLISLPRWYQWPDHSSTPGLSVVEVLPPSRLFLLCPEFCEGMCSTPSSEQ